MKILIVSPYAEPHTGGIESIVAMEMKHLCKQGHEVMLVTSHCHRSGEIPKKPINGCQIYRIAAWNILERRANISWPIFSPSLFVRLWQAMRWCDAVHVHGHLFMPSPIALLFSRILKTQNLLTMHGRKAVYQSRWKNFTQHIAQQTIGRSSYKLADVITTQALHDVDFLKNIAGGNTDVQHVFNPLPSEEFKTPTAKQRIKAREAIGWDQDRGLVLFVGSLRQNKGVDILLEAGDPSYDILFVGQASSHYKKKISQQHMFYLPPRPKAQIHALYHAADMLVLPSYSEAANPLVVNEALMCGLPVVLARYQGSQIYDSPNLQHVFFCDHTSASVREVIKLVIEANIKSWDKGTDHQQILRAIFPSEEEWTNNIIHWLSPHLNN